MAISAINTLQTPMISLQNVQTQKVTPAKAQSQFTNNLKNAIDHLNQVQGASDKKTEALARGEINDLHDVMITAKKSSLTLQTAVEVQRKVIDAYNEVMRMQV
ncbi:flagellar hook-basal body complex protein FliE [Aquibacillus halophilus]|uniref:Flagellar hook-basal body complex protein FliE n=1 Tax=Aquibacillus halophilus TaxID=930132 RepID=A0A6A8D917_9BACI|nr:flagellar hook-basal body complex protein FliE [Aquibacillus halophilus]MRH42255.1 flagellar hook-basal body complex protein FliE [Aquibacillus halophilus]